MSVYQFVKIIQMLVQVKNLNLDNAPNYQVIGCIIQKRMFVYILLFIFCLAPEDATRLLQDGLWSRETQNNPFANYFKVSKPFLDIFKLVCSKELKFFSIEMKLIHST